MIDSAPRIQIADGERRPRPEPDAALTGVATGFLVDALGGSGALDYRIKPVVPEQASFCGRAVTCNAGPADNLAVFAALKARDSEAAEEAMRTHLLRQRDALRDIARNQQSRLTP